MLMVLTSSNLSPAHRVLVSDHLKRPSQYTWIRQVCAFPSSMMICCKRRESTIEGSRKNKRCSGWTFHLLEELGRRLAD